MEASGGVSRGSHVIDRVEILFDGLEGSRGRTEVLRVDVDLADSGDQGDGTITC